MKIAILGHSGSGKSTLAARLGAKYGVPALHLDTVHFLPGWVERPREDMLRDVEAFMDANDQWVIDGNYSAIAQPRRLAEADRIIIMQFNRFSSLYRAWRRYRTYRGQERSSMAAGCPEKLDWAFVKWILWEGRSKRKLAHFRSVAERYPQKTVVIRNQRQLDEYMRRENIPQESA